MKKKTILFVFLLLILLLLSTSVLAQQGNIFEDIFGPLFGGLDVNTFYSNYQSVIDFIIAFMVFLSIAQLTIKQKFPGRPGTAISVALAFALSFGFSYFLQQQGLALRDFGPIAFIVFLLVVGLALYRYFTHWGEGVPGVGALLFVVGYLTTKAIVPGFYEWIGDKVPIVNAILQLVFAGSLVYTFIVLFRVASKSFRGELKEAREYAPRPELPRLRRREEEKKEVKEEMERLPPAVERRIEFTTTPLLELRKTGNPYMFVAEVMRKDGRPFDCYNFVPFINHINNLMQKEGKALRDMDKKEYEKLREALQNMNQNKKIMLPEYWNDLRDRCFKVAKPIFGKTTIVGWNAKKLKKEIAKKEAEEMMGAVKVFIDGLKAEGIFKVSGNEIDRVKLFFVSLTRAIEAYENLKRKHFKK